jgi:hypothetical protein
LIKNIVPSFFFSKAISTASNTHFTHALMTKTPVTAFFSAEKVRNIFLNLKKCSNFATILSPKGQKKWTAHDAWIVPPPGKNRLKY